MKDKKTRAAVLSVGIGTFMSSLDSSIVNLAMPLIKSHFGASLAGVEWIIIAYLLVVSSLLLTFGRLADMYGHKRVYQTGFIVFIIGSALCGASSSIAMLIVCRSIQAIGASMLFSTGPAIITNSVPPESRGKALSVSAVAVALGLCTGPVAGGTLATLLGWQSIFYVNIPIGILGEIMVIRSIPKDRTSQKVPFDIAGSVMVFFALLMILLPLDISGDYSLPPALFIGSLAAGVLLIVGFVFFELHRKHPMLNVRLFKNRVFAASNTAALFTYMAQSILVFLTPFFLVSLRGYSALLSGLLYLPMPLATMCVAPISGAVSDRFDSRYLSSFGAFVMALGLVMLSFLDAGTPMAYMVVCMAVTGIGFGMFQTPNNSAIMGNVPPEYRGTASGTLATMRNIGMVVGVALSGALFSFYENRAEALFTAQGLAGKALSDSVFAHGLQPTYIAAAIIALLAMTASLTKGKVRPDGGKPSIGKKE